MLLDLGDVGAVVDARSEVAPHRHVAERREHRAPVDVDDGIAGLDELAGVGQPGEGAAAGEHERCRRAVAEGSVELVVAHDVLAFDGHRVRRRGLVRVIGRGGRGRLADAVGDASGAHAEREHHDPEGRQPSAVASHVSPRWPGVRPPPSRSCRPSRRRWRRELVLVERFDAGPGDLHRDHPVVREHRVGHVDAVLAHALGVVEHLLAHLRLPLGIDGDVGQRRLHQRSARRLGLVEDGVPGLRAGDVRTGRLMLDGERARRCRRR